MSYEQHRHLSLTRPALSEPSHAKRFLQRALPSSWRFAHHMASDLVRQVEFLAWSARVDAFDTYFLRQAEAMLRPTGLTALVSGQPASALDGMPRHEVEARARRFAAWSRALVTAVLLDLDESPEVVGAPQALTCLLSRDLAMARAAAGWIGRCGMAPIERALGDLPGYALVLLAARPNDTAERFMARDAFWVAVMKRC